MQKIPFTFRGFKVTYQPNGTNHLIVIVPNDVAASIIYPQLSISAGVSINYNEASGYFDLFVTMNDSEGFFELNFPVSDETKTLATFINRNLVTNIWIGYYRKESLIPYGAAIELKYH